MTIKEVEEELGLPRATIRFYEKEKLFAPKRNGNTYREYSEEDIVVLKKIIILRKSGFSVLEIKDFLERNVELQELLEKNIRELQEKVSELNGAIKICKQMQSRHEDFESFNEDFYWEEIYQQEKQGDKFIQIINDSIGYEKYIFYKYFELLDEDGNMYYGKKELIHRVLKSFLVAGGIWFLFDGLFTGEWGLDGFFKGLMQPIIVLIVWSLFGLPWYLIKKKYPQIGVIVDKVIYGVIVGIPVAVALVILGVIIFK